MHQPSQLVYRPIRHSPSRVPHPPLAILRQSTAVPLRLTTPLRHQRSISHFENSSSSLKKHQDLQDKENLLLQDRVKTLKEQISILEAQNKNKQEVLLSYSTLDRRPAHCRPEGLLRTQARGRAAPPRAFLHSPGKQPSQNAPKITQFLNINFILCN